MPEFHMPTGSWLGAVEYSKLDEFTQGYVEAMFWLADEELADASFLDLAQETLEQIERDCEQWQTANAALLERAYARNYSAKRAGVDYWLTRNGHGAGFWDRDELTAEGLGDALSAAAGRNSTDLYKGDDGKLYLL